MQSTLKLPLAPGFNVHYTDGTLQRGVTMYQQVFVTAPANEAGETDLAYIDNGTGRVVVECAHCGYGWVTRIRIETVHAAPAGSSKTAISCPGCQGVTHIAEQPT